MRPKPWVAGAVPWQRGRARPPLKVWTHRPSGARERNGTKLQEELSGMEEAGETAGHCPRL